MSILIKDMEIPKSCSDCFAEQRIGSDFGCGVIGFEDGNTTCFTNERRKDCPLIEIKPHGRLIDADAFRQFVHEKWKDYDHWIIDYIDARPTIIEAEDGDE